MNPKPHSIPEWKQLAASDPELAATTLIDRIAAIAPNVRRSVFASLPNQDTLTEYFSKSSNTDKTLSGVPFLLKDLYDFPGVPTTASSSFLSEIRPIPPTEAALSKALRSQGAVYAGKTHLNEFAYGLSGENPTYGNCPHPIFPTRLSGGSSSGSAWAVRSGIVPIAAGTDTGGSIRVPAAWCGLFGIRLTPAHWAATGCFPLAPTFDTPGWFTATSQDMATSIETLLAPMKSKTRTFKGVNLLSSIKDLSSEFRAKSLDTLESLNAQNDPSVTESFRVASKSIVKHYSILQSIEAFKVHRPWLDAQKFRYDPAVWQRIDRGRHWTPAQIEDARTGENAIKAFFTSCFKEYDFIVLPATQSPAISAAEHTDLFRSDLLALNAPGSFARCPVLTIPIHLKSGESQGLQILYRDENSDLPLRILERLP